jgi:hypothetical protein
VGDERKGVGINFGYAQPLSSGGNKFVLDLSAISRNVHDSSDRKLLAIRKIRDLRAARQRWKIRDRFGESLLNQPEADSSDRTSEKGRHCVKQIRVKSISYKGVY